MVAIRGRLEQFNMVDHYIASKCMKCGKRNVPLQRIPGMTNWECDKCFWGQEYPFPNMAVRTKGEHSRE